MIFIGSYSDWQEHEPPFLLNINLECALHNVCVSLDINTCHLKKKKVNASKYFVQIGIQQRKQNSNYLPK